MEISRETGLLLTDVEKKSNGSYESNQYEPIKDLDFLGMSDNGEYPTGNSWLVWGGERFDFDNHFVVQSINLGAIPVKGFEAKYHQAFKECTSQFVDEDNIYWSAVSSASSAFFIPRFRDIHLKASENLEDYHNNFRLAQKAAEICQRTYDEMLLNDDLDTLAARVMG